MGSERLKGVQLSIAHYHVHIEMRNLLLVPSRYFIGYCCVLWYMFLAWLHRGGLDVIVICTNHSDAKIYNRPRIGAQQMQNTRLHHITRLALLPAQHTQVDPNGLIGLDSAITSLG